MSVSERDSLPHFDHRLFVVVDDDLDVQAFLKLCGEQVELTRRAADGEALNIGSTNTIEIQALATEIRDQLAPDVEPAYAERYAADADHTHADIREAAELVGYDPLHTIAEGVSKFLTWYRENRYWYAPLVQSS